MVRPGQVISPFVVSPASNMAPGEWIVSNHGSSFEVTDTKREAIDVAVDTARVEGRVGVIVETRDGNFDRFIDNDRVLQSYHGDKWVSRK